MRRSYTSPLLMRLLWFPIIAGAAACGLQTAANLPPTVRLSFTTGIVYVDDPNQGYLYVASSNFDRRFDSGSVSAIQLSAVADANGQTLPPLGQPLADMPHTYENIGSPLPQIYIQTFAGEMDQYRLPTGQRRLFVPSRGDRNPLQIIDVNGSDMVCLQPGVNCGDTSLSLTAFENTPLSKPRAPEPIGVGISSDTTGAQVFVTHLKNADSPMGSGRLFESYFVYLDANAPSIDVPNFVSLGFTDDGYGQTTSSVVVGQRYAFVTSRYHGAAGAMILLVDRQQLTTGISPVRYPFLETTFSTLEARGIALGHFRGRQVTIEETRIFVAARSPDSLVVVDLRDPSADIPTFHVVRTVPLPDGPNQVKVIPRARLTPPLGDLVVITSSTAGVVSIYDDDLSRVVAQIFGVGVQPFGIAIQAKDTSARIFITDFGDGRIAVIDIPQLWRPQDARLVAYLGKGQTCPSSSTEVICLGNPP